MMNQINFEDIKTNLFISDALFGKDKNGKIRFWKGVVTTGGFYSITGNLEKGRNYSNFKANFVMVNPNTLRGITAQTALELKARYKLKINGGLKYLDSVKLEYDSEHDVFKDNFGTLYGDIYDYLIKNLPKFKYDENSVLKPMLAKKFKAEKVSYPRYGQPKINGIRGLLRWDEITVGTGIFAEVIPQPIFTSREGNIYYLPHLSSLFPREMFRYNGEWLTYDGELYIHGESLNRIKASCPMVKKDGDPQDVSGNPDRVQFWIFDLAILRSQEDRFMILDYKLRHYKTLKGRALHLTDSVKDSKIVVVPTIKIDSDIDAIMYAAYCIDKGFEGCILRDPDSLYNFGSRGAAMVKVKKALHTECKVINVIPKPREPETGMFVLKNDINTETFECNPMGTFEERAEYLNNKDKYIGKMATVKYYERSGVAKVPFHANVETIRDYE